MISDSCRVSKSSSKQREPKSRGRDYIEKQLQKQGYSRRSSVVIVDEIFNEIKQALVRGEEVEFPPLGKLKLARHKHPTQTGQFLNRTMTTYKKPFTVVLEMSPRIERCLNSAPIVLPPKPGSPPGAKPLVIDPWKLMLFLEGKIKLPPKPASFLARHPIRSVADVLWPTGK